jgi:hypothetical protein
MTIHGRCPARPDAGGNGRAGDVTSIARSRDHQRDQAATPPLDRPRAFHAGSHHRRADLRNHHPRASLTVAAYFLDTSTVVKRYVLETGTLWVQTLADTTAGHFLYVARITDIEMTASQPPLRKTNLRLLYPRITSMGDCPNMP